MLFEYEAQCDSGAAMTGRIEAGTHDEAMGRLDAMGLANVSLKSAKAAPRRRALGADDFVFFNEQLASLAKTGLCLDVGLRQLGKEVQSRRLRRVLTNVADDIERGLPLDQALPKHMGEMPGLYASVVRAGIASGQLSSTLLNLSHHLRLIAETRRLVFEALSYPAVVLGLALLMVCGIVGVLGPQFEGIFLDFDVRLPVATLLLIELSRVLPEVLIAIAVALALPIVAWFLLAFSLAGQRLRERVLLRMPILGAIIRNSIRARFLRAVAFSVDSGIPLPEAVRLSADATGSPAAGYDAKVIVERVEAGGSVFEACAGARVIPPMFGYVVDVNSARNALEEGLLELAKAYESRAVRSQWLMRAWLAPLAIVGVGLVIAFCILALFMPFVSMLQSVGG